MSNTIRLGFIPLLDAAPLIMALEEGSSRRKAFRSAFTGSPMGESAGSGQCGYA